MVTSVGLIGYLAVTAWLPCSDCLATVLRPRPAAQLPPRPAVANITNRCHHMQCYLGAPESGQAATGTQACHWLF
ncbi:hypothetical protein CHLRE_18g748147v5 [Chlamydomonas reinhardtii]|uniref:Secreted protein n=1 Tax=Chlamydomonas reinhardtii TaxID=3055 RepID=A0A2K3CNG4_CHLRE|nr:uncharacterized protein CHLRE_18g748147v5 [Chlamydomonas reinhardtii]PNW69827.1 hypothetical protein CHLRE_18g748147v5 [Chlamydomonas reinhardtii]